MFSKSSKVDENLRTSISKSSSGNLSNLSDENSMESDSDNNTVDTTSTLSTLTQSTAKKRKFAKITKLDVMQKFEDASFIGTILRNVSGIEFKEKELAALERLRDLMSGPKKEKYTEDLTKAFKEYLELLQAELHQLQQLP